MSNKTQLQMNNDKYASLIETLRGKAVPSGEDVTAETEAYTTKIASLETAVTALETELQGKASSGSGGGSIDTCTVEIHMQSGKKCLATTIDTNGNVVFSEVTSVDDATSSSGGIAVIENVVCNSLIHCNANLNGISITGTATIFRYSAKELWTLFRSPSVANEHCIISW